MLRAPADEGERGAVLVMMAILLVVLLGVTALAVDLGVGRAHKREVQSGVDAGALGGAQDLIGPSASVASAETTARDLALSNISDGTWASACEDGTPLASPGADATDCISFDTSFTRIRVYSPTQEVDTLFSRVWGRDVLRTRAVAEARLRREGLGAIIPLALGPSFNGPEVCIYTDSPGQALPPCTGPQAGNFRPLDIRMYGNETLGTLRRCLNQRPSSDTGPVESYRFRNNVAIGVDHELTIFDDTTRRDVQCVPVPNTVETNTGLGAGIVTEGLLVLDRNTAPLDDGGPPRLQRGDNPKENLLGSGDPGLDDRPLWEYIPPGLTNVPTECRRETFEGALTALSGTPRTDTEAWRSAMNAKLTECFAAFETAPPALQNPVFTVDSDDEDEADLIDLELSPRFVYVPVLGSLGTGNNEQPIVGFRAVFIQRIEAQCTAGGCPVRFEPGTEWDNPVTRNRENVNAIAALLFHPKMLPTGLAETPSELGRNVVIELVR